VGRTLEAGCGTGYTSRWLRTEYDWTMFLVDIESAALRFVRREEFPNTTQADIRDLAFRDGSFDVVLSFDVLVHVPRGGETRCITEFFRVMAPGGVLVLRAAAFDALRNRHSRFIDEKQRFTRGKLIRAVVQSGFRVLRSTYANSLLLPISVAKFRIWEPFLRKPPASAIEPRPAWLDTLLYLALALEAKWLGAGFVRESSDSGIEFNSRLSSRPAQPNMELELKQLPSADRSRHGS